MRHASPHRNARVSVRGMQRSIEKALTDVGDAAASLFDAPPAHCADSHAGLAADSEMLASVWREVGDDLRAAMAALPLDAAVAQHAERQRSDPEIGAAQG